MSVLSFSLYEGLPWQFTGLFVFFGALLGSFFNVLALRWPAYQIAKNDSESSFWLSLRGINHKEISDLKSQPLPHLLGGRSHCPKCGSKISLFLNIPILSWIALLGKSACCKRRISFRYLAYELFGSSIFLFVALMIGPTVSGLLIGCFLMLLSLIAVIDLKDGFIPEELQFFAFILSYLIAIGPDGIGIETAFTAHIATLVVFYSVIITLSKIAGKDTAGSADLHLTAICASFLGKAVFLLAPLFVLFSVITLLCIRGGLIKRGIFIKIIGESAIPAGPAIVMSTYSVFAISCAGYLL